MTPATASDTTAPAPGNPVTTTGGPPAAEAPGVLTIDLGAIFDNYRALAVRVLPTECAAVVKGDAYGCGIEQVVATLTRAGCKTFFVAHLGEARRVRAVAPEAAIYVLNGFKAGSGARTSLEPVEHIDGCLGRHGTDPPRLAEMGDEEGLAARARERRNDLLDAAAVGVALYDSRAFGRQHAHRQRTIIVEDRAKIDGEDAGCLGRGRAAGGRYGIARRGGRRVACRCGCHGGEVMAGPGVRVKRAPRTFAWGAEAANRIT